MEVVDGGGKGGEGGFWSSCVVWTMLRSFWVGWGKGGRGFVEVVGEGGGWLWYCKSLSTKLSYFHVHFLLQSIIQPHHQSTKHPKNDINIFLLR